MKERVYIWVLLAAFVGAFSSGCATTWKEKSAKWAPAEPVPALLAYYKIEGFETGTAFVGAAALGKSPTGQIGEKTLPVLKEGFAPMNMALFVDGSRAKKVDEARTLIKVDVSDNVKKAGKFLGKIAAASDGTWQHPETAIQPFHLPGTMLKDSLFKGLAKDLAGDDDREVFVSIGIKLKKTTSWLIFDGCELKLRARALNSKGVPVFEAQAVGVSSTTFFGPYTSKKKVLEALTQAMGKLQGAKWEAL